MGALALASVRSVDLDYCLNLRFAATKAFDTVDDHSKNWNVTSELRYSFDRRLTLNQSREVLV